MAHDVNLAQTRDPATVPGMTDNPRSARLPDLAEINANIRAELARAKLGPGEARTALHMGEVAWRTRMQTPGAWRLAELEALASWLGLKLTDLVS